ncbi:hypothetical protein GCM10020358_54030 [Amorphoplanes nipponensis]|uniref:DUF397 domain-containing protein n=1 Tax=Actinoplanes nipponensis TaxID=135950 RepID=A0A919JI78_9ACTN|nr:DUF397 domain-containing protein [Actinoplanes nipponensis]GIE51193.1 hypothetical protein Ani05nite_47270 [Actinoplanes nipponensis]
MAQNELSSLRWIRRCADHACVEVALYREAVLMRDSKDNDGPMLTFTLEQWTAFRAGVRAGEFDRG